MLSNDTDVALCKTLNTIHELLDPWTLVSSEAATLGKRIVRWLEGPFMKGMFDAVIEHITEEETSKEAAKAKVDAAVITRLQVISKALREGNHAAAEEMLGKLLSAFV
jgi:hypothetical protein